MGSSDEFVLNETDKEDTYCWAEIILIIVKQII
jgi:hypothetical protein